jgi:hypothetical protein
LLAERVELKPHSVASWLHYGDALDKLGDRGAVAARERAAREARRASVAHLTFLSVFAAGPS